MPAARGPGQSCRAAFYGFEGWQTVGLNALKTDDSGRQTAGFNALRSNKCLRPSCREAFYGLEGWQTARLNALTTDGSGRQTAGLNLQKPVPHLVAPGAARALAKAGVGRLQGCF